MVFDDGVEGVAASGEGGLFAAVTGNWTGLVVEVVELKTAPDLS